MVKQTLLHKRVIITGASMGLGKEIAIEVAKRGGIPILIARSKEKLQTLSNEQSVGKWLLSSTTVAKKVVDLIEKPKREVNMPKLMNIAATLYQLFPTLVEKLGKRQFNKK